MTTDTKVTECGDGILLPKYSWFANSDPMEVGNVIVHHIIKVFKIPKKEEKKSIDCFQKSKKTYN